MKQKSVVCVERRHRSVLTRYGRKPRDSHPQKGTTYSLIPAGHIFSGGCN